MATSICPSPSSRVYARALVLTPESPTCSVLVKRGQNEAEEILADTVVELRCPTDPEQGVYEGAAMLA